MAKKNITNIINELIEEYTPKIPLEQSSEPTLIFHGREIVESEYRILKEIEKRYMGGKTWADTNEKNSNFIGAKNGHVKKLYIGNIGEVPRELEELVQLQELDLGGNQITDITSLSNLTQLQELGLGWNQISDITPLSNMTQLQRLYLNRNQITDITPLSNMTQLQRLYLGCNQIRDIRPLSNLIQLRELCLPVQYENTVVVGQIKKNNPGIEISYK